MTIKLEETSPLIINQQPKPQGVVADHAIQPDIDVQSSCNHALCATAACVPVVFGAAVGGIAGACVTGAASKAGLFAGIGGAAGVVCSSSFFACFRRAFMGAQKASIPATSTTAPLPTKPLP